MQQSLRTFDRQALSRWDTLRDEQAALLGQVRSARPADLSDAAQLGVPSFAPHSSPSSPSDRARVISKLVNMLERH